MKSGRWALGALALASLLLLTSVGSVFGGFTTAPNVPASVTTGTAVLSDTVTGGTGTCTSAAGGSTNTNAATCADALLPTGTLPATGSSSKTVTLNSLGTITTTAPTFTASTCGLQSGKDSIASNDGIVHGTVTNQVAATMPPGNGAMNSMSFSQSASTYLATPKRSAYSTVISGTTYLGPQNFSIEAWFKFNANTDSGTIIGFTDLHTNATPATWDRHIWLTGRKIYWGVYPGSVQEVSSGTLNAGTWYQVVATVGPTGQHLYINGAEVGTANTTVVTAQSYNGYWHIGWGNEIQSWANPPANAYWPGSLAKVAIIPSQLSAAQVATLNSNANTTSSAAQDSAITALSPTYYWKLDDPTTNVYTGTIPNVGGAPLKDATGSGNNASIQGGVTTGLSGPLNGSSASFDGVTGNLQTTTQYVNPKPLTLTAYFNTSVASGTIIEWSTSNTYPGSGSAPTQWDRHVWIDNTGHLVWGVYPNAVQEITSPGTYNDGNWHQVTVSVGTTYGMKMYVDGVAVAVNAAVTTPEVSTGYWHLGWGNENNGWTNPPANPYWSGRLAQVAVFPTQLTDAQVASLAAQTTPSALQSTILGLSPTSYWPLQDTVGQSAACAAVTASVQVTQGATTTCVYPAGAGACASPPTALLSGLGSPATLFTGSPQTLVFTVAKGTVPAELSGTHLYTTMKFGLAVGGFTAALSHASGPIDL